MLKHDLVFHLYKLQTIQELRGIDFAGWKKFCEQLLHFQLLEDVLGFSEEVHFELNTVVNKQNMCYWLADSTNWQIAK